MLFLAFLAFPPAIVQCIIYSTLRSTPSTQAITLAIMNKKRKKKKKIQRLTLLDRMHLTNKDMDTMAHCNIIHLPTQTLANVLAENN